MKRFGLFLLAVTIMVGIAGCNDSGSADVQKGSEGLASWNSSGRIHAYGNVINIGDDTAENVTLTFYFWKKSSKEEFFREARNIGPIRAGERVNFDEYFNGPRISDTNDVAWNYDISWD